MDKDEVYERIMHVTITTLITQFMRITQSFVVSLIPLLTVRFQIKLKVLKSQTLITATIGTSSWRSLAM